MSDFDRAALFGKLHPIAYAAIEAATVACRLRGQRQVELVHWVDQLLRQPDSDLHRIVRHAGLDEARLAHDVTAALERLPGGATAVSDLSADVEEAAERAWNHASLARGEGTIRSGHLMMVLLRSRRLRHVLERMSGEFARLRADRLSEDWTVVTAGSPEESPSSHDGTARAGRAPAALGGQAALERFTTDLTASARDGDLDRVVGRDDEIRQLIDVLMRRRQNNPMLVGEAGVGKTAVVEGLARRIVDGDVPPALADVCLRSLDIGLLQAGASAKGEFESRLRQVIDEVQASVRPVILFIDEVHTLVGAGGAAGTGDAANLLKPMLARGSLRTIGATTWSEYKRYIEKDPALVRRFQAVQVAEPDEERAIRMLRAVADAMETHHGVQVLDTAIRAAVKLSHRYVPTRQLPDKAVSLLDTACARVAVSRHAMPAEVIDLRQRIDGLAAERDRVAKEQAMGMDRERRLDDLGESIARLRETLAAVEERWREEEDLVRRLLVDRGRLLAGEDEVDETMTAFRSANDRLACLQGEHPLVLPWVDDLAIGAVVADWTGIPLGRMLRSEADTVLGLADVLERRVIGQAHAMDAIARRVRTSRAGLDDPSRPVGVFLLAGTSGVGKTETALALAEALYGGEQNLITLNMSEFQESHSVATIKGAPPGYVGYGEGGVLTEAVRRRPHAVVLLDEIEKAHPDVHELFYQVFDKGTMEDGEGRAIDFRNTLILLTTNVGTERIEALCRPGMRPSPGELVAGIAEPLGAVFPKAFLGRVTVVPYLPLRDEAMEKIVALQLERVRVRVAERYGATFGCTPSAREAIVRRCAGNDAGGRAIHALLTHTMLPDISRRCLEAALEGARVEGIVVDLGMHGFVYDVTLG
ncbi:type VI secretion system ATPase TssH [Luteibacter aegosomatis]|uniref:type VI secretion system ATPase TssH n=1 Tax=Luteibacter aegosomatis TaxID=2911537 RepID=UPI001FFB8437|nr:type VI secretion system ATPase TssH [Luteibacter aegosomatis]UPG84776.1 type VI secretion system ATPase TssH [Luteibacter aegosomatis]